MIEFKAVSLASLLNLRNQYLDSLHYPQELHCEWLVAKGGCFCIEEDGRVVGYFIRSEEGDLIEFYLPDKLFSRKEEIFGRVLEEFQIKSAFCKSFDDLFMACCHAFGQSSKIGGYLFRFFTEEIVMSLPEEVTVRKAKEIDIPLLLTHDSDLYESPEELNYTVSHRMILMYEKDGVLLGCGYLIRVLPDKEIFDVGMWVNPAFRRQGYATLIISHLKETCLKAGYTPIAGCAADNIASRRTLEKCGFMTKHCAIVFEF